MDPTFILVAAIPVILLVLIARKGADKVYGEASKSVLKTWRRILRGNRR
jgi:hypothetical protein